MSIISDMKPIILQEKIKVISETGAIKYKWVDVKEINATVYLVNDMRNTQSIIYNESTHVGLTYYKDIGNNSNRLKDGETIYTITKINPRGRFTSMLLKVIEIDR